MGCFSAVVVPEAAWDDRPRSFADSPEATISIWASALDNAPVSRLILLDDDRLPGAPEGFADVTAAIVAIPTAGRTPVDVAVEVARIDDLDSLTEV
jgi:hypothetical protein